MEDAWCGNGGRGSLAARGAYGLNDKQGGSKTTYCPHGATCLSRF